MPSNWVQLTSANIRLLDTERTIMDGVTPVSDLDACIKSACDIVRGYVAGGGNTMEAKGVPPECVVDALSIARYDYLNQDPTGTLLTPLRQKEYDNAIAHLQDIADEKSAVTQGDTGGVTPLSVGSWGSSPRIETLTQLTPWANPPTPPP